MKKPFQTNPHVREACYIGGEWIPADSGKVTPVINPATGEVIGAVPDCGEEEAKRAVAAAKKAFKPWAALTPLERGKYLHKFAALITEHADELARILTIEQGKPLAEAKGEVLVGASYMVWSAEEARRLYGEVIPSPVKGKQPLTFRQPLGVAATITPWNFPSSMITRKAGPALAAGCPMVIRPASLTPFSALALAVLAEKAGLPDGVFNVITGNSGVIGSVFCESKDIRALSFTGSTNVGKMLAKRCTDTMKKVSLELGGNAPFIAFADSPPAVAAAGAIASKFRNSGQTCICANRVFVEKKGYDAFVDEFVKQTALLKVGNGLDEGVTAGPLITLEAAEHMAELIDDAVSKGAKIALGGKKLELSFFEPTILTHVTPEMRVFREEIFGPIAPVFSFESEDEVVELANDTDYGLASYLYTRDIGRIYRLSNALEYGMVGVNDTAISLAEIPFGGVKESGAGREGGKYGLEEYTDVKYVMLGGLDM